MAAGAAGISRAGTFAFELVPRYREVRTCLFLKQLLHCCRIILEALIFTIVMLVWLSWTIGGEIPTKFTYDYFQRLKAGSLQRCLVTCS